MNHKIVIGDILPESTVDGIGLRLVVFTAGCIHYCKGCHNPKLWPIDAGTPTRIGDLKDQILRQLTPLHEGVTISGGDPLLQPLALYRLLRELRPHVKSIWVYTGYDWDQVKNLMVMQYIDVLVDGKFMEELKSPTLAFRGSVNQRLVDVKRSLASGFIVEFPLPL